MTSGAASMRALVFDEPATDTRASRIATLPVPEPGPGEVAVDVHHAGVNFKDVMARRGDTGYALAWPYVPGLEVSGTVRSVGPDVESLVAGERVAAYTGDGGLAEVAIARADLVARVPAGLSLDVAAAAPGALVTAALLVEEIGRTRPGDIVLVHSAAGGVGQAVLRQARLAGASFVIGTVGHIDRVASSRRVGYDCTMVRGPGLAERVRDVTDGYGVDLVLDPQGTSQLEVDLAVVAAAGRIVLFGNAGGSPLAALPPAGRLYGANASIGGFSLARLASDAPHLVTAALERVLGHQLAGELDVELTTVHGLEAGIGAQQALAEGRGQGKQIVSLRE